MKKVLFAFVSLMALLMIPSALLRADRDRIISPNELPAAAQAFVTQYFPDQTISYAKKEIDHMRTNYEVRLEDGTEISFTSKGDWDKVERHFQAVPEALIPPHIAAAVQERFPNASIVKIDKERGGYDVELNNELELKFNKNGRLVSVDD